MFTGQKMFMVGERYSLTDKLFSRKTAWNSFYTWVSFCCNKKIEVFFVFQGILEIFRGISKFQIFFLFIRIYSTIFRGTPYEVTQNPDWETPPYSEHKYNSAHPDTSAQLLSSYLPLIKLRKLFRPVSSTDILHAFTSLPCVLWIPRTSHAWFYHLHNVS
jgi:hypothetical protein